ncbi:hypothetical protein SK128_011484 [Halocaridina rubra]|uniref:Sushi, von Willebrand factor type A, EGF and pentraxin domain-containing protein 1 n=1 Tax=Halocaridina rubra TaxID=373956 RepID=A0AAN8XAT1_HALRR
MDTVLVISSLGYGHETDCCINCSHFGSDAAKNNVIINRIANGYIEGGPDVKPGEQVEAKCDDGYKLQGDPYIICKDDAAWSLPLPKCVMPVCSKPPPVEHGQVKVRASATSKEAVYKCDDGYVLVGKKTLLCDDTGEWDGSWSTCVGIPCPEPIVPSHASISRQQDVWRTGDVLTYECNKGFVMHGEKLLFCLYNGVAGEWNGDPPTCEVIKCPVPSKPQNGIVSIVHRPFVPDAMRPLLLLPQVTGELELRSKRDVDDEFPIIFPDFPRVGVQNRVDDFPHIGGEGAEWPQISDADYSNYDQSMGDYFEQAAGGSYDYISQNTGHGDYFGQSQPLNPLELSQNTGQSPSDYDYFSQSQNGYDISQSQDGFEISQHTGQQQGANYEDFYDGQSISSSSDFDHGIELIEQGQYQYGTVIEYDCRLGYILLGERQLQCTEFGNWNTTQPRCYEQFCHDLPPLQNGHIIYYGSGIASRAEYVCDNGYKLTDGDFELLCELDKSWSGTIPTCTIVDCGIPPDIENGTLEYTTTTFGSLVNYDCFFGYVLEGSFEHYCGLSGKWNNMKPKCVAVTCSVPPVIEDGYITFEGSLYVNSPIEYECKECYYLNGTRYRYCQVDGSWSLEEPYCTLLYCDELPKTIPNGRVIGDDNSCGSLVEYECSPGYIIQGSPTATCLENSQWSSPVPVCERVSCGFPPVLVNGNYIGTSFKYTDKITYKCNEGHILQGTSLKVCGGDGKWSGSDPYCAIVNCTKPSGPANGKVKLSGIFFGSIATVVCDPGFKLEQDNKAVCEASGKWSKKIPNCAPVICPDAPVVPFSFHNSTDPYHKAFSSLLYECLPGYRSDFDRNILACNSNGVWEGNVIRCDPVNCGDPGTLPHGSIEGNAHTFDSIVSFQCDKGYKLLGHPTATCLADGSWSNYATSCLQITCPEPPHIQFGELYSSHSSSIYGATISYKCDVGYMMTGSSNLTCNINGVWTGNYPTCRPVTCPEPFESLNAQREGDVYEYGKAINYTCNEGFSMKGEPMLVCQADGTWSNNVPVCEIIFCDEIPDIPNGSWDVMKLSDIPIKTQPSAQIENVEAFRGAKKTAKIQRLLQEDAREMIAHTYGDIIEFKCNLGYFMASSNILECAENGWNSELPQCHPISCPIPIQIRHGTVIGDNYSYRSVISYECDEGHELVGVSVRRCQENKEWTDTEPLCRIIECPRPAELDHGQTIGFSIKYGSVLSYICDVGFTLEGIATRMCQSDGHWTGEQPVCVELFCDLPDDIPHGIRDIGSLKVGGTVRYSCSEGYHLVGRTVINCDSNGLWDAAPPVCHQIDCGYPASSEHVIIQADDTVYNSKLSFMCDYGYRLEGHDWATCLQSGKWSNELPICEIILCTELSIPVHGRIVEREIMASESLEILQNKKIKHKRGRGRKSAKQILPEVAEKMYYVDDEISWECDEGFQLEGEGSATCLLSGEWSSNSPRCRRVSCGPPELPSYASVHGIDFLYASSVYYTCREGYELQGESVLTCESSGQWNSSPPTCEPVFCGPLVLPEHVQVRYVILEHHNKSHSFGSSAFYSCDNGYQLVDSSFQVCESHGQWSGSLPRCEEMLCTDAPHIPHGIVVMNTTQFPQTADVQCDKGYSLQGNSTIACRLGQWQRHSGSCEAVNCFEPTIPPYGKITAEHFNYGSIANYSCLYGYMLTGNPSVVCEADGTWRGEIPICQPIDCGTPEVPRNGHVESSLTDLNSEALYYCNSGYQLFGNDSRLCTANATWEGDPPQCHRVDCGEISPPKNGFVLGVGTLYEDQVKFACTEGHVLIGEPKLECMETGNWSSELPECQPVACGLPPEPPNAEGLGSIAKNYSYGEHLSYRCRDGYITRGRLTTVCLKSGKFSKVEGQCSIISCGRPKINTDGAVILGRSFYYRDKVIYRCPPATIPNGSNIMICQGDGFWSGAPSCVGKCGKQCLNGGICASNNVCMCPPGFMGDRCQYGMCLLPCLNGGSCIGPYKCRCPPGYGGERCHKYVCESGCGHHGHCIGPNVCHCDRGYTGPACDEEDYDYESYYDGVSDSDPDQTKFSDWDFIPVHQHHLHRNY